MMRWLELKIPPVGVGLLTATLAWAGDTLGWLPVSLGLTPAVFIVTVGFVVAIAGVAAFRKAQTTVDPFNPNKASSLVTGGIYRHSRNPMYLGMLLVLMGWALYLSDGLSLALTLLFVPYMIRFQIKPEERVMREKFGEEFDRYCNAVRRWV
ncbi:MAG: isoprenylcysteine carboxylmethyltransferase family protein [Bacteroidota bacterium]|nr:isoprenylcysteine carboxylmethyltransferase family protein [Bacteroidota bacterium]